MVMAELSKHLLGDQRVLLIASPGPNSAPSPVPRLLCSTFGPSITCFATNFLRYSLADMQLFLCDLHTHTHFMMMKCNTVSVSGVHGDALSALIAI